MPINQPSSGADAPDCVIIGAGIGGSLLALLLGRAGMKVTVLEKERTASAKGADFLKPRGIRILDKLGLLSGLLERGALIRDTIDFFHDSSLTLSYRFAERTRLGYFLIAPYRDIVETVLHACAQLPNVEVRFSSQPSGLEYDSSRVAAVTLQDGSRIPARMFVDTTGPGSPLYGFIAPQRDAHTYDHVMRMATVPLTPASTARNRLWFSSDRWFAYLYPVNTTEARMFIALPTELDAAVFEDHSIDLGKRLGEFTTESPAFLRRLNAGDFERVPFGSHLCKPGHRANVALLGSAAFACHPMTGQGMSYTMQDAVELSDILAQASTRPQLLRLLDQRYSARTDEHARLVRYGDDLARTYPDRNEYLALHASSTMHGGDL